MYTIVFDDELPYMVNAYDKYTCDHWIMCWWMIIQLICQLCLIQTNALIDSTIINKDDIYPSSRNCCNGDNNMIQKDNDMSKGIVDKVW